MKRFWLFTALFLIIAGRGHAENSPDIIVEPSSLPQVTMEADEVTTQTLTITNSGSANLSVNISTDISPLEQPSPFTSMSDYVEGEILVKFKSRNNRISIRSLYIESGARSMKTIPGLGICHIKLKGNRNTLEAIDTLRQRQDVEYAEPNYIFHGYKTPNDLLFFTQWGLHNIGPGGYTGGGIYDADIDAPEAWNITTGNSGIIVAHLDSGIDYTHPDLAGNIWINPGEIPNNGIDDDNNGYIDDIRGWDFVNNDNNPMDDCNHGTFTAGVMGAAGNNSIGISGVCWNVKIMPLKVLDQNGSGELAPIISALAYAIRNGARITNNSYGSYMAYEERPLALQDAIEMANGNNQLFIAAAGNRNWDNDNINPPDGSPLPGPNYPSSFDLPNIIAVAGSNYSDRLANAFEDNWDSSYGKTSVDLAAPGDFIWTTAPFNLYQPVSGTSLATPFVAGACALVWSKYPGLMNLQVKEMILRGVDPIDPALGRETLTNGRLNVYKSLMLEPPPPPISTSWLTVSPKTGIITPGGALEITVIYNSTGLTAGLYSGIISITSNDPDTPQIELPAEMLIRDNIPPAAPTEFTLSDPATETIIVLSWQANTEPDLAGYNIYRNGTRLDTSLLTNAGYIDTDITKGTAYAYTITAVDTSGNESASSNSVSVVQGPPKIPTGLKARTTRCGSNTIYLSWDANNEVDLAGYNLYIEKPETPTNIAKSSIVTSSSSYYHFQARNAVDNNPFSYWIPYRSYYPLTWIKLNWHKEAEINKIALRSRPGGYILNAILEFSNGSRILTGPLPYNGNIKEIRFTTRKVRWIRLRIIQQVGNYAGLSEFEVYNTPKTVYVKRNPVPIRGNHYLDRNLIYGSTYKYVVTAVDRYNNESGYSEGINVAPLTIMYRR